VYPVSEKSDKAAWLLRERNEAYSRAMEASVLVSAKYFENTDTAVRTKNKGLFMETCDDAGVSPDLRDHMWKIVDAAYETVYAKQSPNPIW
jgi:hypothetical protein